MKQFPRSFLCWVAVAWLISVETATAGDTAGIEKPHSAQSRHKQASSQLLRGTSDAKILDAALVSNNIVAWSNLAGEISDSPVTLELETPRVEGGEYKGTVVNDVYVRWDRDECSPCEVPTLAPTLPAIYPNSDDSYESHVPVVTDEYDSWDYVKEGHIPSPTDAPTAAQDEEDNDEITYDGGIRCSKITAAEQKVYLCESPAGNVYCTKVATEYGESYDCHPGTVQPPDTTSPPTTGYEPPNTTSPPTTGYEPPNTTAPPTTGYDEPTPAPTNFRTTSTTSAGTTNGGTATTGTGGATGATAGGTSTGTTAGGTTTSTGTSTANTSNTNTDATTTPSTAAYGGDVANTAGATTTDSNTASARSPTDGKGLSAGAIVGIVIGCAVFVAIVVGAVLSWQKSLARQREENLFADLSDTGGATDYAAM